MIADVANPEFFHEWWPCRLFDATGSEVSGSRVVWADTETGECVELVPADENGRYKTTVNEVGELTFSKRWVTYPAPLRLERMRA